MNKAIFASLALAAGLTLAACSEKAQDETAEAANAVATDVETTTDEAVNDIEAATNDALSSAENTMDNGGAAVDNAADNADNAVDAD